MFKTTAVGIGRQAAAYSRTTVQQQVRRASGHNVPEIAHNVNESMGWAFYATFATLPVLTLIYQYSRPGADGEMHWITRKVFDYQVEMRDVWRDRNVARTQAIERAAHDKHLFLYANMGEAPYYEVRFPDAVMALPRQKNIGAGQLADMGKLVEHYRQQHLQMEEKKAKNLIEGSS